jgi:hypothetical protein
VLVEHEYLRNRPLLGITLEADGVAPTMSNDAPYFDRERDRVDLIGSLGSVSINMNGWSR